MFSRTKFPSPDSSGNFAAGVRQERTEQRDKLRIKNKNESICIGILIGGLDGVGY
jgi:hypothetical protein